MKKVLKIFIFILFELLAIPIALSFALYFIYRRKVRAIKLMDNFYNTLIIIENKLQNF
jgi:EamA domain-containing membrane protein RarD